ncbi:MAG: Ig-like domain-containing protein [bacterium]|nr:Ig-like domain-containing protein [bacterium]
MKKLSIFLLIFSVILTSVTPAYSWPWSRNRRPLPPKTATIQGRVTNSLTNQAISGAAVRAGSYRASTNANGQYVIKNINVWFWGRIYRVSASANGYYSSSKWIYVRAGRTYTLNFRLRPKKPLILVKITSPEDNSYISGSSLDVKVAWQGRAGIIDLYLDNSLAGSYRTWRWWHRTGIHTFKIDISVQQDGEHKLKAIAYRSHMRKGYKAESKEITFVLDNTSPVISALLPEDNALINNNQPEISAVLSDATSGIGKETIILKLDDAEVTSAYDEVTGELSYTPETALEDGIHTVSIEVKDRAENEASASSTFRVETDTTPPSITDLSPKDASTIYYTTPKISVKYSDDKSGIDKTTVKMLVNAVDVTASSIITDEGISYKPTEELTEGGVTVNIEVKDKAGNLATKEFSFEIKILTAEDLLQAVKNNHDSITSMKTDYTVESLLNSEPVLETQYVRCFYKDPSKTKLYTYEDSDMTNKLSILIMDDTSIYDVDPNTGDIDEVNTFEAEGLGIEFEAYGDTELFFESHDVTSETIDGMSGIGEITAVPENANDTYSKIKLKIDYPKEIIVGMSFYDNDDEYISGFEVVEAVEIDGIWVPKKVIETPALEGMQVIQTYSNIEINVDIPNDAFDPGKQL